MDLTYWTLETVLAVYAVPFGLLWLWDTAKLLALTLERKSE